MSIPKDYEKVCDNTWKEVMKNMLVYKPVLPFMISRKECDELIEGDQS